MNRPSVLFAAVPILLAVGCATFPDSSSTRLQSEDMIAHSFTAPDPALLKRLTQDKSQQICSKLNGAELSHDESAEVVNLARASVKYPASNKLTGDWKIGERLAHDGA